MATEEIPEYVPLTESGNVAVDDNSGDLFVWNSEVGEYELYDYSRVTSDPGVTNVYYVVPDSGVSTAEVVEEEFDVPVVLSEDSVGDIAAAVAEYAAADGYNLGTSYNSIFSGIAYKVPYGQNYVYWRDDQYSYKLAYGDLILSGTEFTSEGDVTVIDYTTTSGYNSVYSYTVSTESDFSLSAGSALVYSDLGPYPELYDRRGAKFDAVVGYAVVVAFVWTLFGNLRKAAFGR